MGIQPMRGERIPERSTSHAEERIAYGCRDVGEVPESFAEKKFGGSPPDGSVVAADMAHGESRIVRVARLVIIGGDQRTQAGVCETASLLRRERAVCD